jgi:hypothetical protein
LTDVFCGFRCAQPCVVAVAALVGGIVLVLRLRPLDQ